MKLDEIYRSGTTDNEPLEDHSRSSVNLKVAVNFAHEQGLEEAFAQLLSMPAFHAQLAKGFTEVIRRTSQEFVKHSSAIKPGYGWQDDFETEVTTL